MLLRGVYGRIKKSQSGVVAITGLLFLGISPLPVYTDGI